MAGKRVFVTVGTTKYEKLIETILQNDILEKLKNLGYKEVQFQTGSGAFERKECPDITLKYDKYFENFIEEIKESDLVISHAGAGTCLDVLKCGKPLIIVINEDLMDNHQKELGEQLENDEYVYLCTCQTLIETLDKDLGALRKYPQPNKQLFSNYLNKCMGFA